MPPRGCLLLSVSILVAAAGCRGRNAEDAPSRQPLPALALALAAPGGSAPVDREIAGLQARVRAGGGADDLVALGQGFVRKARQTSDAGLYLAAAEAADAALALEPASRRAAELRGLVLLQDHRFAEARALAEGVLARAPDDRGALGILSDALVELGCYDEALSVTQRLVDLKPNLPSYLRASHLLWLQGDAAAAREVARLAVDAASDPRDPEPRAWALAHLATLAWHEGDLAAAAAAADEALRLQPGHAAALVARGRVAMAQGDARAAAGALELSLHTAPLAETAWLLGDAREALSDAAGARAAFELVRRHGRAFDRRTLAQFLSTRGEEPDEAVRLAAAERAVRDDVLSQDVHAWALFRAGRLAEARAASDLSRRLGTRDARLLFHAGAIRLAGGERAAGLALVRAALRQNPAFDRTGAAEARRLLGSSSARLARTGGR